MKESKKFFENNNLNKGFIKSSYANKDDIDLHKKKYQHVLPPVDMIEYYEELYPGTLEKLLDMAEREQNHRHSMDLIVMEKYNRATKLGRIFSLVFVALVSFTSIALSAMHEIMFASIFAFSAFTSIVLVSYFYSRNSVMKEVSRSKKIRNKNFKNKRKLEK